MVSAKRLNLPRQIKQGEISLISNTPLGKTSHYDEQAIRKAALQFSVPCVTTITDAEVLIEATGDAQIAGESGGQKFAEDS